MLGRVRFPKKVVPALMAVVDMKVVWNVGWVGMFVWMDTFELYCDGR